MSCYVIGEKLIVIGQLFADFCLFFFFCFFFVVSAVWESFRMGHMELPSFGITRVQRGGLDRVIGGRSGEETERYVRWSSTKWEKSTS
jgi:hypothetical protein